MKKYIGQIALDIDGTVTASRELIADEVVSCITELAHEGWLIHFVTGRTFHWSMHILHKFSFPFVLSAFNGAESFLLPEKKLVSSTYMKKEVLTPIALHLEGKDIAMVLYTNTNGQYRSYFVPKGSSRMLNDHLVKRFDALREECTFLKDISELSSNEICAIRCFGLPSEVQELGQTIECSLGLLAPQMTDSYDPRFKIVQITDGKVSKGSAIKNIFDRINAEGIIIGCGDDYNDVSMLEVSDIKVVMASAPPEIIRLANIVAPPACEHGIIKGLSKAIEFAKSKNFIK